MALSDIFASSFAGLRYGLALLDSSARTVANPSSWGQAPATSSTAFQDMLFDKLTAVANSGYAQSSGLTLTEYGRRDDAGQGTQPREPETPPPAISVSAVSAQEPDPLLNAMMNMLIAQRMIEANARLISVENKVVGTIIDLGRYPGDTRR